MSSDILDRKFLPIMELNVSLMMNALVMENALKKVRTGQNVIAILVMLGFYAR
jgi:hypothetical protein